jgi:hypothetical protein
MSRVGRGPARSYVESCALLDEIVGRCVRDAGFGRAVLDDPETALREYNLNEDELDDFRALRSRHRDEAAKGWAVLRAAMRGERH